MAYEVTANRKRPQNFAELAGQDFISVTLKASIESGRVAHAYLFSGPRGCGKTSTARILAKSLNCERGPTAEPCGVCASCQAITKGSSLDVIEIDGASNTSVDNVRQIKDEVLFPPNFSKYKIYIIDEVHMLSNSAFNALLKTIEEPPPYIIFIFATTELHKVPATIRSRCQQFIFRLIPLNIIRDRLADAARDLGIKADDDALMWIAREATGSLRDAYTLFDQVASFSEGHIRLSAIQEKLGIIGSDRIALIVKAIATGDRAATAELIETILVSGISIEQLLIDTIGYTRTLLFIQAGVKKQELLGFSAATVPEAVLKTLESRHIERMLGVLLETYRNIRYSVNPRYEIELALLQLCDISNMIPRKDIIATIEQLKRALREGTTRGAAIISKRLADNTHGTDTETASDSANASNPVQPRSSEQMRTTTQNVASNPSPDTAAASTGVESASGAIATGTIASGAFATGAGAAEAGASEGIDTATLKARVIAALGKQNLMLTTILTKSEGWEIEGETVKLSCASSFEADRINSESTLLNSILQNILGRIMLIKASVRHEHKDAETETEEDAASDGESSAAIVEKVFRGTKISEE